MVYSICTRFKSNYRQLINQYSLTIKFKNYKLSALPGRCNKVEVKVIFRYIYEYNHVLLFDVVQINCFFQGQL